MHLIGFLRPIGSRRQFDLGRFTASCRGLSARFRQRLWPFRPTVIPSVPVELQSWLVRAAPDQAESAGGLMVATFQVAIAMGAVFGGLLVDHAGVGSAFAYCGAATLLAAIAVFLRGPKAE